MEELSLNIEFLNVVKSVENIKKVIKENVHLKYLVVVLDALLILINENNPNNNNLISSHISAIRHCIRFYLGKSELSESLTPFIFKSEKVVSPEPGGQRVGYALDNPSDDLEQEKRMQKEQEYLDNLVTEQQEGALKKFLFDCWAELIYNKRPSKKFFISYAWPKPHDDFHDESHVIGYLFKLVEHFIQSGMQVCIDQFHSGAGKSLGKFMGKIDEVVLPESDAYEIDHVLVVSTRTLPSKLSNSGSGCSCEHRNMRERIEKERSHRFIIPILLNRINYLPETFKRVVSINFCTTPYLENFKELFRVTHALGKSFIEFCDERISVYGLGVDVCIATGLKEKYTSPEVATIEYLTYTNSIPLYEGFVNLAVVREEEYQERERRLQRKADVDPMDKPLESIALDKMGESDVAHTLVEGPAGMGKSTLMRYFANQWAQKPATRNILWLAQYDAVVLLPLRRLHEYDKTIELATFVLQECISADYQEKLSVDMIRTYLLKNKKIKILYLLDGLDEVASLLVDSRHSKLLESLLKKKYWLLTSRPPCQVDRADLGAVRHLQNMGFLERDIEKYVKQFFGTQEAKISVLMRMLENNSNIRSIANVPINLEFMCTVVQSEDEQSQEDIVNMTVTQLYEKVLVLLLRRYLLRLQELKLLPVKPNILNLTSSRILGHPKCQAPLKFLQELAWLAFQQKTFLISSNTIRKVFKKFFTDEYVDQDVDNLFTHLFLLKPTGQVAKAALDQNYFFVHMTFLELFVAQRFFNGLLDKTSLTLDVKELNLLLLPINQKLITQENQVLQFLAEMLKGKEKRIQRLREVVLASRPQSLGKKVSVAASNAITILNTANVSLLYQNFNGVQVPGANLYGAMLWGSSCREADFTDVNLAGACLQEVDFSKTKMQGVNLGEWPYIQLGRKFNYSAFSKDGKYLALAVENIIEIYSTEMGKLIKKLKGHTNRISCVAFDDSGRQLVSGSQLAEVVVWDVASGKVLQCFGGHNERITFITFDSTGEKLASGSLDNNVIIWDTKNRQKICQLSGHRGAINSLVFHPKVEQLISGSDDGTVRCWDTVTGKETARIQRQGYAVTCLALDANAETLAASSEDGCVRLWNLKENSEEVVCLKGHDGPVRYVRFDVNGEKLVSSGDDGTVRLWGIFTKTELQVYRGHSDYVSNVVFEIDEQRLASVDSNGCIRFWALQSISNPKLPSSIPGKARTIVVNARGNIVATAENNTVRFWSLTSGKELLKNRKSMVSAHSVGFDLSGERVAFANDKIISIVDTLSGKELQRFERKTSWIKSVVFDLDNEKIFFTCKDDTARLWDLRRREELFCVVTAANNSCIAMHAKSGQFAYVEEGGFISVQNSRGETTKLKFSDRRNVALTSAHFDVAGEKFIAGDEKGSVGLWDIRTFNLLLHFSDHTNKITQIIFNPQGDKFLSASIDQFLRFYDVATGVCLLTFEMTDPVFSVVWEKVDNENILIISYGKNLACYLENPDENNFSLTLRWATTDRKLVLKGVIVDDASDLDKRNRSLVEQQTTFSDRKVDVSQQLEEVDDEQATNEAIISSVHSDKKEPFHTVVTGEGYQPIILVYDILNENDFVTVLNRYKCIRKNEAALMWNWYWQDECASLKFESIDTYVKNPEAPELLGYIFIVNRRCYIVLPSFKRACLTLPFFHEPFKVIAKAHGALFINTLFVASAPNKADFSKFLEDVDLVLQVKNRAERYEEAENDGWDYARLTEYTQTESSRALSLTEYFKFEDIEDKDPQVAYLGFYIFLRGRELVVIRKWFGQLGYTLSDVADETMSNATTTMMTVLQHKMDERSGVTSQSAQEKMVATDEERNLPLELIAKSGDLGAFEQVLSVWIENGDDVVDKVNAKNKCGETALHWAALKGFKNLCALLLDLGATFDVLDDEGKLSPMQWAIWKGREEIVELFLERGARVNEKHGEGNNTGIQIAAAEGHVNLVEKFIQKKLDDPKRKNSAGRTALHLAAREDCVDVALLLLKNDSGIDDCDTEFGNTPLHHAAAQGHVRIVNVLLAAGADASMENNAKQTPQELAAIHEQAEVFEVFCGITGIRARIQLYQMRLQRNPGSPTDHHKLARCYSVQAQQEPENAARLLSQAEDHCVAALKFPACTAISFAEYGSYLVRSGRFAEAVLQLLRAVEAENENITVTFSLVEISLVEKDLQEQIISEKEITLNNQLYALHLLIRCYIQLNKQNEAEAVLPLFFQLAQREQNRISYRLLSLALREVGKIDEAKKYLRYVESPHPDSEVVLDVTLPLLNALVMKMDSFSDAELQALSCHEENDSILKSMVPFGAYKTKILNRGLYATVSTGEAYLPIQLNYTVVDVDRVVAVLNGLKCCKRNGQTLEWIWFWTEECENLLFTDDSNFVNDKKRPLVLGKFSVFDRVLCLRFPSFKRARLAVEFFEPLLAGIADPSILLCVNRVFVLGDETSKEYEQYFSEYTLKEVLPDSVSYYYMYKFMVINLSIFIHFCEIVVVKSWENNQALSLQGLFDFSEMLTKVSLLCRDANESFSKCIKLAVSDFGKTSREMIAYFEEIISLAQQFNNLKQDIEAKLKTLKSYTKEYADLSEMLSSLVMDREMLVSDFSHFLPLISAAASVHNLACARFAAAVDESDVVLLAEAETTFQHALALKEYAGIFTEYGIFLLKFERYADAVPVLKKAVELKSTEDDVSYVKRERNTLPQEIQLLIDEHEKISLRADIFAYYLLGICYIELNQAKDFLDLFPAFEKEVLQSESYFHILLYSYTCKRYGLHDKAAFYFDCAAKLRPADPIPKPSSPVESLMASKTAFWEEDNKVEDEDEELRRALELSLQDPPGGGFGPK